MSKARVREKKNLNFHLKTSNIIGGKTTKRSEYWLIKHFGFLLKKPHTNCESDHFLLLRHEKNNNFQIGTLAKKKNIVHPYIS